MTENFGAALVAEGIADEFQFLADHFEQALRTREDVRQIADLFQQLLVFANDLVLLEAREPVEAHLQNRLRLRLRQPIAAFDDAERGNFAIGPRADRTGARQHFRHRARLPDPSHQGDLGFRGRRRGFDGGDDLIDVGERNRPGLPRHVRVRAPCAAHTPCAG